MAAFRAMFRKASCSNCWARLSGPASTKDDRRGAAPARHSARRSNAGGPRSLFMKSLVMLSPAYPPPGVVLLFRQSSEASRGGKPDDKDASIIELVADWTIGNHALSDTLTGHFLVPIPRLGHTVRTPPLPKQNVAGSNPVSRSKSFRAARLLVVSCGPHEYCGAPRWRVQI
jgi:hypothetical protein